MSQSGLTLLRYELVNVEDFWGVFFLKGRILLIEDLYIALSKSCMNFWNWLGRIVARA